MIRIRAFLLVVVTLEARPVQAQRMMGQFRFSASAAVNVPISDLDKYGNAGFGIAVRTESPLGGPTWSLRSGVSYDRFGGKGGLGVDHFEYLTFASDLVHHTNTRTYQFLGLGIYQAKTVFAPVTVNPFNGPGNGSRAVSESDFGFQGGVGLNFGKVTRTFLEIGIVDVLTTGRSSVWFPLRYGIRL
jgi:hypothetical protein